MKKNLISIDLLRFFAAFSVYWYHQHLGFFLSKFFKIDLFQFTDQIGATYAVPLFFLISGFCIQLSSLEKLKNKKKLNLSNYYKKRFIRIYPPYVFCLLISMLVNLLANSDKNYGFNDVITHLFILQGFSNNYFNSINIVLWTITIESAFYIIYPLYYLVNLRFGSKRALVFSAIVTLLSITFFYSKQNHLNSNEIFFFTNLWFGWCLGAWLCQKYYVDNLFFKTVTWKLISCAIILSFIGLFILHLENMLLIRNLFQILIWAPPLMLILSFEDRLISMKRFLTIPLALGISSYSLYLLHEPLIILKNFIIDKYIAIDMKTPMMILGIFIIPMLCYVNYLLIEKPLMKLNHSHHKTIDT